MDHERLPDGDRYGTARGVMVITRPAPHVQLVSGHGFADRAFVDPLLAARELILREQGLIALFDDLEHVTGYDSEVRVRLTSWASARRAAIIAHHILVRSRLIAMGASVASLALGGSIRTHARRSAFEQSLSAQVTRPRAAG